MSKIIDIIISTQLATIIACLSAFAAHLIDLKAGDNWQFAVYIMLIVSMVFMLFPYLVNKEHGHVQPDSTPHP